MCIEEGCGNTLTEADHGRFPEYLSRPLPATQQNVFQNDIQILNMRLRCSNCYMSKYHKRYIAFSYRWAYENRQNALWTVNVHGEAVGQRRNPTIMKGGVPIPVLNKGQRDVIMNCPLFFLDVINAPPGSQQWQMSNLVKTYASSCGLKALLNASDHRALEENRKYSIHQTIVTRDRGGYLGKPFGQQERMAAYSQLRPHQITFVSMYGRDMGNIEVSGMVKGNDNVYQRMLAEGMLVSGSTRPIGSQIARRIRLPPHDAKKKNRLRMEMPDDFLVLNPDRISGSDGLFPPPALAYETPSSVAAGLDIGSAEFSMGMNLDAMSMTGSGFGEPSYLTPPDFPPMDTGVGTASISMGNLNLDAMSMTGSAESSMGMNLDAISMTGSGFGGPSYLTLPDFPPMDTGVGTAPISMGNLDGRPVFPEMGPPLDPYFNHLN